MNIAEKNLIYKCIHGSRAYGLNTPESDTDIKGIFIPSKDYYFGMKKIEQQELGKDHVIYAIKKFVNMARECNPNIIEVLFCNDSDILYMNKYGKMLRDNRDLFISKKARYTFGGYAFAQLQRIKGHKKWINSPVIEPKREDFMATKSMKDSQGNNIPYLKFLETEYDKALKKYNQYLDWKKNRNPERAILEKQFGLDTKHGCHLIRLLNMGLEIVRDGKIIVKRPDREFLLGIRNGKVSYEELIKLAEQKQQELDEAYKVSPLPKEPDYEKIDNLLIQITEEFFNER